MDLTQVTEWHDGKLRRFQDYLAGEEPLEIRVGESASNVTMRTPGHDRELAAGFLFTEGLIQRREQIVSLEYAAVSKETERGNVIEVALEPGTLVDLERTQRSFLSTSSCGICGKSSIESVRAHGMGSLNPDLRVAAEVLCSLPETLRAAQAICSRTGGLHAAGLFNADGKLLVEREDVGRHNAVDKVIGWALLEGRLPLSESVLMVSGRGGFEIVQKAAVAGIPFVASVSAPSGLAVRLAREVGHTLVGLDRKSTRLNSSHRL